MTLNKLLTLLITTLVLTSPNAQSTYVAGVGTDSCGKVTLAYTRFSNPVGGTVFEGKTYLDEPNGYTQWMAGFISAHNILVAKNKPAKQINIDPVAMGYWLKTFCANNPTKSVAIAADTFITEQNR